jgi:uncharacterized membrane protein
MRTPASFKNHPIHPILIVFPLGLWMFSLVCDLIYMFFQQNPVWKDVAFYTIGGGLAGALLAAVPGLIDYASLRDPAAKKTATQHMILNLAAVAVFGIDFFLRIGENNTSVVPVALSVVGVILISISGYLGGDLVYVHHVGVQPQSSHDPSTTSNVT